MNCKGHFKGDILKLPLFKKPQPPLLEFPITTLKFVFVKKLVMTVASAEINKWYETLKDQILDRNEKSVATWSKYKTDLETTKSLLNSLPKKVKHDVMVPIGPKALMRGSVVHTNEFLVNLGEVWFAKKTAYQTIEVCNRRIKSCNEMIQKLEGERKLILDKKNLPTEHEAFGNEERPEIIEYITEKENEEWKKQHRVREKEYRQKLAELRRKEKKSIETEEDLWKHLDELELQEELEDELNRLNAECSEENFPEENDECTSLLKANIWKGQIDKDSSGNENKNITSVKAKRKVSFVCDLESAEGEPLRLEIKHSCQKPLSCDFSSREINTPADIYNQHLKLTDKTIFSVLKNKSDTNICRNVELLSNSDSGEEEKEGEDLQVNPTFLIHVHVNDISERPISQVNKKTFENSSKKSSKFKLSRKKAG